MSFYAHYATRERNKYGELVKKRFAYKVFDLIAKYKGEESVLEIGPGDGYIADIAMAKGLSYFAVEGSSTIASALKERKIDVVCTLVPPLPKVETQVDCCVMLHVLEHMDNHIKASELLCNIHSIMKEEGIVVIAVPDYLSWGWMFYDADYTHSYPLTKRRLHRLLEDNGFNLVFSGQYSGCCFGKLPLLLAKILRFLYSDSINSLFFAKSDLLYRGVLTFMPNLLVVARKS